MKAAKERIRKHRLAVLAKVGASLSSICRKLGRSRLRTCEPTERPIHGSSLSIEPESATVWPVSASSVRRGILRSLYWHISQFPIALLTAKIGSLGTLSGVNT